MSKAQRIRGTIEHLNIEHRTLNFELERITNLRIRKYELRFQISLPLKGVPRRMARGGVFGVEIRICEIRCTIYEFNNSPPPEGWFDESRIVVGHSFTLAVFHFTSAVSLFTFAFSLLPSHIPQKKYLTRFKPLLLATLPNSPYIPARKITLQKLIE